MRITGGTKLRHTLKAPDGLTTRPTSDKVREALFNILMHNAFGAPNHPIENVRILDAFCGTGALAFEALSRGATEAILFDKDRSTLDIAKANATSLGLAKSCKFLQADATKPLSAEKPCTLIFLDPPYHKNFVPKALLALDEAGWLAENSLTIIETAKNETLELPKKFQLLFNRSWGDTAITITLSKNL